VDAGELTTLVPAGGLGAILLILVGYLLKQIPADRADYRRDVAAERKRTAEAESRITAANDRAEFAQLQVDEERQKRRDAEGVAAAAEARVATQHAMLEWYAAERTRLLRHHPPEISPGIIPDARNDEEAAP
jgi:uncharacterized protein YdaU (DUF1376 family)